MKLDRHCGVCGKVLKIKQTKFCCKKHWLEFEDSAKRSRQSISKTKTKNFKPLYESEEAGKRTCSWGGIYEGIL